MRIEATSAARSVTLPFQEFKAGDPVTVIRTASGTRVMSTGGGLSVFCSTEVQDGYYVVAEVVDGGRWLSVDSGTETPSIADEAEVAEATKRSASADDTPDTEPPYEFPPPELAHPGAVGEDPAED